MLTEGVTGLPQARLRATTLTKAGTTSLTVPAGHRYYLAYVSTNYVADATVATRICTIYIDHGTPETHLAKFDVTASQNMRHLIGAGNAAYTAYLAAGTQINGYFPMIAGDVFKLGVSGGVAGDDWSQYIAYWDVVIGA